MARIKLVILFADLFVFLFAVVFQIRSAIVFANIFEIALAILSLFFTAICLFLYMVFKFEY